MKPVESTIHSIGETRGRKFFRKPEDYDAFERILAKHLIVTLAKFYRIN